MQKEHADEAADLVFACERCKFITVNRRKYELHVLNHDASPATTARGKVTMDLPAPTASASGKRIKVRTGLTTDTIVDDATASTATGVNNEM